MCMLCNAGRPQNHFSRRNFLKSAAATGFAATGIESVRAASGGGNRR